jgi:hypothetical protein
MNKEKTTIAVNAFLDKCALSFISLIQILGHNKARQREKFGHILFELSQLNDEVINICILSL